MRVNCTHTHTHTYTRIIYCRTPPRRIVGTRVREFIWNIHHCNRNPLSNRQNTSNGILPFVYIHIIYILYASYTHIAVSVFVCQLLSLDLISITNIIYYYNARACVRASERARASARVCVCVCKLRRYIIYNAYVRVHMMRIWDGMCTK